MNGFPMSNVQYTHGHHDSVLKSHRWRTAENSAAYLLPHLRPGFDLLDIGCGPGTITVELASRVAPGRVSGVDSSEFVIAEAVDLLEHAAVTNVDFAVADAYSLSVPDASFDVVHAHQVLQHLTDPVRALTEMRRVCRRGGLVAARDSDYSAMAWYPRIPALDDWMTLYQQVARSNAAEPDAGRYLRHWARRAGFTDVVSSASVWCYSTPQERAWWGGLWADRVVQSNFAVQAAERGFADVLQLAGIADGWREWAADDDAWFAVLHGEELCRR
jgi:ubiquinone/menaquinone biosynthesis C-methylase UbiE